MEIHHTKHHATYITNLNAAEEQLQDAIGKSWYIKKMMIDKNN